MSEEYLKHEGRLYKKQEKLREIKLRIDGLIEAIRDLLDPFEKIEDLKVEHAFAEMADLARLWVDYKGLLKEIALIEKTLGR